MFFISKNISKFVKPLLFGFLLLLIALSPFGFHTVNAGFCQWVQADSLCHPVATVFADLLMIPMVISAWILWLAGVLLNTVLTYTVVELSTHISRISGINIAWATIRDLSNMVFIFVLLYAAIGTILGIGKADWKNTLKNIVIAAVLINFSLLGTKIIIDASNIFTLGIYKQIVPDSYSLGGGGMSNVIMKPLGLTTLYNPVGVAKSGAATAAAFDGDLTKIAITSIGASIFMIVTAGVFFGVASMFIIRYVTFIFLLILSPVAVMSNVLPQMSGNAKKWQSQLSAQATFAPIFMILLWVVLTIINSPGFLCTANTLDPAALAGAYSGTLKSGSIPSGTCTETGLILNFVIVTAFMSAILGIAQKTSNQAMSFSNIGFGFGAAGFAGRNIIGRGANKFLKSDTATNLQAKEGSSRFARTILGGSRLAANSSFDARATRAVGAIGKAGGVNLGSASGKGGFVVQKKATDEFFSSKGSQSLKDRNERVRLAENKLTVGAGASAASDSEYIAAQSAVEANSAFLAAQAAVTAGTATPAQTTLAAAGAPAPVTAQQTALIAANKAKVEEMSKTINRMSTKEVEQVSASKLKEPAVAKALTPAQYKALIGGDKLTVEEKEALKKARFGAINTWMTAIPPIPMSKDVEKQIKGLTSAEIENLDPAVLADERFIETLSASQVAEIQKSERFTETQRSEVGNLRNIPLFKALTIGTYDVNKAREIVKKMSPELLGKLATPPAGQPRVLTNSAIFPALSLDKLKRLPLSVDDPVAVANIRNGIIAAHVAGPAAMGYGPVGSPEALQVKKLHDWLVSPEGLLNF